MPHFVELSDGEYELQFQHVYENGVQKETVVTLKHLDNGFTFRAKTKRNEHDQFCKETGRKYALRNLFNANPGRFMFADRTILWSATLPKRNVVVCEKERKGFFKRLFKLT